MDTAVQEFDGATQSWITPEADPVVETPAVEAVEAPEAEPVEVVAEATKKPRDDPKARMLDATAKEAAAKRERDEAKAESAKLQARIAELEARTAPKPELKAPAAQVDDAEPTVDQFDSYEKFVKAQARWEARQEIRQQEQSRQMHEVAQAREHQIRAVDQQFSERYQAILTKDPDFASKVDARLLNTPRAGVLADPSKATFGNFLVEQVFQSEQPDALLLHLSDPAVVQRLATLPPVQVIRELAKVELGAASPAGPALKVPAISHAKPPIKPVGSSPQVTSDEPSEEDSDDEWLRKENARLLRQRRASRG